MCTAGFQTQQRIISRELQAIRGQSVHLAWVPYKTRYLQDNLEILAPYAYNGAKLADICIVLSYFVLLLLINLEPCDFQGTQAQGCALQNGALDSHYTVLRGTLCLLDLLNQAFILIGGLRKVLLAPPSCLFLLQRLPRCLSTAGNLNYAYKRLQGSFSATGNAIY